MGLFDVFDNVFDWVDENIGQPIQNTVNKYENYIPTVVGALTGQPWIPAAWNVANQPSEKQLGSGLTSVGSYYAGKGLGSLFGSGTPVDTYQNSFDSGAMAKVMESAPAFNIMDAASSYLGGDLQDSLSSMFGDPTVATPFTGGDFAGGPTRWWQGYNEVANPANTFGSSMTIPSAMNADLGIESAGGYGGNAGGSAFEPSIPSTFNTDLSSMGVSNPDEFKGFKNESPAWATNQIETPASQQNVLDNVTQGSMSLPEGGGMSTSPVLDQPQFSTNPLPEPSTMDNIKDIWKTVNSPIGGVQGAPTWLKAGMGAGKIYGGLQADRLNREAQDMYKDMYDRALSTSDPFASDRALASNKWQAMINNPAAGWEEHAAGIQPELQAAAAKMASGGRRNMLPTLLSKAKQQYMGDAKNRLAAYNPAQFGAGSSSSVHSSFAPGMAALKAREGAGLPAALANIGQEMINPKSLADLFSRFTKPESNWDSNFTMDMI